MSVTINAHQLGRLIEKTASHISDEHIELLHGIRLDVDSKFLYAVASDRYTLAVARYRLSHGDLAQEPWARTIPAAFLPSLRQWLNTMKGAELVTISAAKDRLIFEGTRGDLSITVNTDLDFPDWRGLLRGIAAQTVEGAPFPALHSLYLQRWADTEQIVRVRVTADRKAVLLFGEDFIGAQMPSRHAGVGPVEEETFEAAHDLWLWTLAAGAKGVDMASLPEPELPRFEATTDLRETGAGLLQGVLQSTGSAIRADWADDSDGWYAQIRAGVANWMAYRYLDALYQADPRAAQKVVDDTAEQLDSGEIGEWAWAAAEAAGHDPQKWQDDYEKAVTERNSKKAHAWAERLAAGLNAARAAGIGFRVDDNPHVTYDEQAEEWKAVKPEPAAVTA